MFYTSKLGLCIYIGEEVGTIDYHKEEVLSNFSSTCLKSCADLFLLRIALYKLMNNRNKENSDAGSSLPDAKNLLLSLKDRLCNVSSYSCTVILKREPIKDDFEIRSFAPLL